MSWIIDTSLEIAGMPEKTVADLDKALPGFKDLADALKQLEPLLESANPHLTALEPILVQALPHVIALMPLVEKMTPIIQKAWPSLVSVLPTIDELIAFAESK